jgi:hypothetical protein
VEVELTTVYQLVLVVLTYYLTFSLMLVGTGLMIAGPPGASAVARFFWLRPLQAMLNALLVVLRWVLARVWQVLQWVLGRMWRGMKWVLATSWQLLRDFLLWPIGRVTLGVLHLAAVGFADTVQFLFTGRGR